MKEGSIDIGNIYWNRRLGPWSDLEGAAEQSRQRLAEQGFSEEAIHALVQEHEVRLVSAMETRGSSQE